MMTLERFAREHWEAGALLALKPNSARIYQFNLDKYVLPALGSFRMCDVNRVAIQQLLLITKRRGYSSSALHTFGSRWQRCSGRLSSVVISNTIQRMVFRSAIERPRKNAASWQPRRFEFC